MQNNVLVTGGAGFIGSSLVRKLLQGNNKVIVLDNFVNGKREFLPDNENLAVIEGDITSSEDIEKCLSLNPNHIVHLAAYHFIPFCDAHPSETMRVNTYGTQLLLELSSRRKDTIEKIIFASTAAVYYPSDRKHNEDDQVEPIDIYGISKKAGEDIVNLFYKNTAIPCINARLFNAIGPRETNPHLLPDIIKELQQNKSEISLGNLSSKRDYIYVDDISDGIIALLESDNKSGSYNIGSGYSYSAAEIMDIIQKILGNEIAINSTADKRRKIDRPFLIADNDRLTKTGWKCTHNVHEGIEKTLKYYNII